MDRTICRSGIFSTPQWLGCIVIGVLAFAASPGAADEPGVGEPDISQHVTQLCSDDAELRREAAIALVELGPAAKSAVPVLIEILEQHDPYERREAIAVLQAIGPAAKSAVPLLTGLLRHENLHVQYFSCRALGAIGPAAKPAVSALVERLKHGAASVRHNAATALGHVGAKTAPEIVEPLIAALGDKLHPIRFAAVMALAEQGPLAKAAAPQLKASAEDPDSNTRCPAAFALWKVTGNLEPSLGVLRAHLHSETDPDEAALYLGRMGPAAKDAVGELAEATRSPDPLMRFNAAEALGRIGPESKSALPALRQLAAEEEEEDVREAAQKALKQIEPTAASGD